ncbi:class II aldolase/adducin family protein [Herbiconiux ginsengi]|uniref:Class II Aldolase and Adducin N-terminal domain-containing protein n=1 Tax=Herbiconiux ginsengi TaxID=381665 RepID=A0A1H3QUU8_9MICO|nr:class II aldolase/adducin family protein [Herbiconiux ginsengi]SDZ16795.1 Class II Aldolase and Adducin N-terminal domain-containing protein [Herbiconiux ginsengi]
MTNSPALGDTAAGGTALSDAAPRDVAAGGPAPGDAVTGGSATTDSATAALVELSRQLGRPDRRWAVLAEGNASVTLGDGRMRVKASGVSMAIAEPGDFVEMDTAAVLRLVDAAEETHPDDRGAGDLGDAVTRPATDTTADDEAVRALFAAASPGGRRPSVEALLHAVCLDLPGVDAVGHTHPVPVNALLCSPLASLLVDGSLFPDQIVVLGTDPLLVPYLDPGLKLARAVRRMLRDRIAATGAAPKVVYLQNHGMFALGASTAEVLQVTEMAVKVAEVILGSLPAGGPVFLHAADVARIDTRPDELLRRAALAAATAAPAPVVAPTGPARTSGSTTPDTLTDRTPDGAIR